MSRYKAYHGSTQPIEAFSIGFSGEGNDGEGPGIYFTSDIDDARWYGDNVHEVSLNFNRKWLKGEGEIPWEEVKKMMLWELGIESEDELENITEDQFYESNLSNWAEDVESSFYLAYEDIKNASTDPLDAFLNVWINFYRYKPQEFLQNMVKLGYDGAILLNKNDSGINHYVVYNPDIITLEKKARSGCKIYKMSEENLYGFTGTCCDTDGGMEIYAIVEQDSFKYPFEKTYFHNPNLKISEDFFLKKVSNPIKKYDFYGWNKEKDILFGYDAKNDMHDFYEKKDSTVWATDKYGACSSKYKNI